MSDKPSRNEEEYFVKQEAELLKKRREEAARRADQASRKAHFMKCPKCGADLETKDYQGVQIDQCPECGGMWLDAGEAETLMKKESGGITSILRSVFRGVEAS
jgi:hypothetical protein